MPEIREALF
jgi:hypothetical protein